MAYKTPTAKTYGAKISAANDWNVLVNDLINHESRIVSLEATPPVSTPTNVPIGGIIIWSGSVASIPSGWHICDGAGGTVDLRDRFVIGAGSTYAVGATGGASTHKHTIAATAPGGSHRHSVSGTTGGPSGTTSVQVTGTNVASSGHTHSFSGNTGTGGGHTHGVPDTGYTSSLPPYYALAFIQRIT